MQLKREAESPNFISTDVSKEGPLLQFVLVCASVISCGVCFVFICSPVSILYKSIVDRYGPSG